MKLAWFRPLFSETDALVDELRSAHHIDIFTAGNAHDFVWMQFRAPYELCVYEMGNNANHAFAWPYLLHYSGLVLLKSTTLHDMRAHVLEHERQRDYVAEFTFNHGHPPARRPSPHRVNRGRWPMLRVPLLASKMTVVPHRGALADLVEDYPEARIRYAPLPVPPVTPIDGVPGAEDVVLALQWPYAGEPLMDALAAMAARRPVVVMETPATADWPTLDPQTWLVRGRQDARPIAISIDPRDQDHSVMLATRRLSTDADLRRDLADAAYEWWTANASPSAAAQIWRPLLEEAARIEPPARPADWPAHLTANGSERAREVLKEFGAEVDFLAP